MPDTRSTSHREKSDLISGNLNGTSPPPLDDVALRQARFQVQAAAASRVALYQFKIPDGAVVAAFNAPGETRDARDQLHLVLALTGGAVGKSSAGLTARVPLVLAGRFEALARPLLEAFLVAFERGDPSIAVGD